MDRPGTRPRPRPRQIPGTFWRTRPRPRPRSNIPNGRVFGRVPKIVNKPKKRVRKPKSGANDHGLIFYRSLNHSIGIGYYYYNTNELLVVQWEIIIIQVFIHEMMKL